MALLGPRAAVLQNMLPALGQGVEDHSVWFAETLARLARSIPPIFGTVYGADPVATGHQVRDFHTYDQGEAARTAGPYSALNPDTYYWAHATFVEHLVVAADTFIRPLGAAEKDQIIARVGDLVRAVRRQRPRHPDDLGGVRGLLGRRARAPAGPAPHRGVRRRLRHQGLAAPEAGARARCGGWSGGRSTRSARSSPSAACRERAREILGLPWDDVRERRYRRFARAGPRARPVVRRLPAAGCGCTPSPPARSPARRADEAAAPRHPGVRRRAAVARRRLRRRRRRRPRRSPASRCPRSRSPPPPTSPRRRAGPDRAGALGRRTAGRAERDRAPLRLAAAQGQGAGARRRPVGDRQVPRARRDRAARAAGGGGALRRPRAGVPRRDASAARACPASCAPGSPGSPRAWSA